MSPSAVGATPLSQRMTLRSLLLSAVAVAAIVVGLLAMHSMNFALSEPAAGVAPTSAGEHAGSMAPNPSCDAECESAPVHDMMTEACFFILLVTVLLLTLPSVAATLVGAANPFRYLVSIAIRAAAKPPSLVALSISRT